MTTSKTYRASSNLGRASHLDGGMLQQEGAEMRLLFVTFIYQPTCNGMHIMDYNGCVVEYAKTNDG